MTAGRSASDGLSVASTTDCPSGQKCFGGKCLTQICTPASFTCKDGLIGTCSADGTTVENTVPCATGNYCDPTKDACTPMVRSPGSSSCATTTSAQVCLADGSGYSAATDCATDEACDTGKCLKVVCTPNAVHCETDGVHACNAAGTVSTFQSAERRATTLPAARRARPCRVPRERRSATATS